jgi:hypothetical protein
LYPTDVVRKSIENASHRHRPQRRKLRRAGASPRSRVAIRPLRYQIGTLDQKRSDNAI